MITYLYSNEQKIYLSNFNKKLDIKKDKDLSFVRSDKDTNKGTKERIEDSEVVANDKQQTA